MHADMAQKRFRKPVNVTLDPEMLAKLDGYIVDLNKQPGPMRATRAAVIEAAIAEYLERAAKDGKK